jgi:hypothetical protein
MRLLGRIALCLAILLQSMVAPAQQSTDAAVPAIKNEVQWINDMVAKHKMSQADANARLSELLLQMLGTPAASSTTPAANAQQAANVAAVQPAAPSYPSGVEPPDPCSPAINFNIRGPVVYGDVPQPKEKTIDLTNVVQLNTSETGGEIYTKSKVYVGFVNLLRYTASLSGQVTVIPAPDIPFSTMFTTTPLAPAVPKAPAPAPAKAPAPAPAKAPLPEFSKFSACYDATEGAFLEFQGKLKQ